MEQIRCAGHTTVFTVYNDLDTRYFVVCGYIGIIGFGTIIPGHNKDKHFLRHRCIMKNFKLSSAATKVFQQE